MRGTTKLANAAGSRDPAVGLQELQVTNARDRGWSWREIADALGVSKQAVHKKYADRRILRRGK